MQINIDDREAVDDVAAATEKFASDLYLQMVGAGSEEDNILVSPYSAAMVLSMAAVGAGGDTRTQLLRGLHVKVRNYYLVQAKWIY